MCLGNVQADNPIDSEHLWDRLRIIEDNVVSSLGDYKNSSINIACWLYSVYDEKLYLKAGYKNIYDYSLDKFSFKKSTVSEFLHTVKRFGAKLIGSDDWTINVKYKGFSISQLILMSRYSDSELHSAAILPSDSVRQVREKLRKVALIHRKQTLSQQTGEYLYYDELAAKSGKQIELKAAEHEIKQHRRTVTMEVNSVEEYVNGADKVADWLARGWQIEIKVTGYVTDDY